MSDNNQIPEDLWVEENVIYTIHEVVQLPVQGFKLGYKLKELELTEDCFPYQYFDSERFMFLLDINVEELDLEEYEEEEDDTPAEANFDSLD